MEKKEKVLLSLCIPTNGVVEWVFPVLDSIYSQNVDISMYEVIVSDNGNNSEFKERMEEYSKKYLNLCYYQTEAKGFLNQIEAFKSAKGSFVKFINHRMSLKPDSLKEIIGFVQKNLISKPIVYFTNGNMHESKEIERCKDFDGFIKRLSIWSSWSAGISFWKSDFEEAVNELQISELFPHTAVLFNVTSNREYIIDNRELFNDLVKVDETKKGNYNFYYAFCVEYIYLLQKLCMDKRISLETFIYVKKEMKYFVTYNFINYNVLRKKTAYDVTGYREAFSVYYSRFQIFIELFVVVYKAGKNRLKRMIKKFSEG